ncbi:sigma-70 family RNA polymerase sigma factor [Sulfuricurvum sp.]|uniref:sigma-70 family RNA polymerase sigma factor n=1 Tax=Sulfuricurvum sp. TaxID=2025608 RepID=UPI00263645E5|nr:sigma-70 family RNA polymerase sigma factor [Sulfuricurvum sp.]MDD3597640.1 sigma-70 family RNA polymerase sigma factor [Sulfuricurvum sp.]
MESSLTSLYETFRQPLLRFVRYKTNDEHIAEDIVQEVFIKAFRSIDTLKEGQKLQSWLYAIASNTISDYFRKHHIDVTDETDVSHDEVLYESIMRELGCCLSTFMETLSPIQHDVLQAVYFDELTLNEYAEKNALNLSTVKSHSKRAKTALKSLFEECCRFENNSRNEMVDFHKNDVMCHNQCANK